MKINHKNEFDEYFTKPGVARFLFEKTCKIISKYDNIEKFTWLEPSVGDGCFYKILPKNKIGIDINKTDFDTLQINFLKYEIPNMPLIVIGNPPFGHRGVLALEFMKHAQNVDYIAFILPMFFQSLGKGSIRYRVKKLNLLHEELLPNNSFYTPDGKDVDVKCCFQIWSKNHKNKKEEFSWYNQKKLKNEPFSEILSVFTVSLAKNRECGKRWIFEEKANWYISSTFFKENKIVENFDEVKYKSGIAIVYNDKRYKSKLDKIFNSADWNKYSSLATNGCRHIGKSHIFQILQDEGF